MTFRVDHIVSGVVINVVALGLGRFFSQQFFGSASQSTSGVPNLPRVDIPLLESLPLGLGQAFQNLSITLVAFAVTVPVILVLNRTRSGLRLRSAGENPEATRTLGCGSSLFATRGGPFRAAGRVLRRLPGHRGQRPLPGGADAGLGFIALAALILGTGSRSDSWWRRCSSASPPRCRCGCPDFIESVGIPEQFIRMILYIVTIIAIAGFVGRVQPPAAAGKAYEGGGST